MGIDSFGDGASSGDGYGNGCSFSYIIRHGYVYGSGIHGTGLGCGHGAGETIYGGGAIDLDGCGFSYGVFPFNGSIANGDISNENKLG